MRTMDRKQLADAIVQMTADYTSSYFETFKADLDKQLWAALHVGFITAMKLNGYSDADLLAALEDAQKEIATWDQGGPSGHVH